MTAAFSSARAAGLPDQRSRQRYPLELEVEYRLLRRSGSCQSIGWGKTINVSSGGVLFEAQGPCPSEGLIEVLLNWPFLLEGVCPLSLLLRGPIVRKAGNQIAIHAKQHEFRTAGTRSLRGRPWQAGLRGLPK